MLRVIACFSAYSAQTVTRTELSHKILKLIVRITDRGYPSIIHPECAALWTCTLFVYFFLYKHAWDSQ